MANAKQIRILSVEDHPVFRQGLATILDTEPDMVLLDRPLTVLRQSPSFVVTGQTSP